MRRVARCSGRRRRKGSQQQRRKAERWSAARHRTRRVPPPHAAAQSALHRSLHSPQKEAGGDRPRRRDAAAAAAKTHRSAPLPREPAPHRWLQKRRSCGERPADSMRSIAEESWSAREASTSAAGAAAVEAAEALGARGYGWAIVVAAVAQAVRAKGAAIARRIPPRCQRRPIDWSAAWWSPNRPLLLRSPAHCVDPAAD